MLFFRYPSKTNMSTSVKSRGFEPLSKKCLGKPRIEWRSKTSRLADSFDNQKITQKFTVKKISSHYFHYLNYFLSLHAPWISPIGALSKVYRWSFLRAGKFLFLVLVDVEIMKFPFSLSFAQLHSCGHYF